MHLRSRMQIFHKNVKLYPAFWKYALCLIVCARSHYLAGPMCTPSNYWCMCERVGSKSRYTSQLIHMFLVQTIRFTRRFEGTCHQIPFFTRSGDYRGRGNSTFGTLYVELSGLKDRCTSAAECKSFWRMSHFTRRFGGMDCVWSFVHDPTTSRDVCVLPRNMYVTLPGVLKVFIVFDR